MGQQATPIQLFEKHVPLGLIQDTLRLLFSAYGTAFADCEPLPWEVAHDFRGHRRRALIEQQWPAVAKLHESDGVTVSYQPNHTKSSYYAQIVCGPVVLTESCVDTPQTLVQRAVFRRTLARSNQPNLFGDDPPPLPDDPLYALLIHGEDNKHRYPYFAGIVFPSPDCREYLERISLFSLCYALVDTLISPQVQEETIPDQVNPQLRPRENRKA